MAGHQRADHGPGRYRLPGPHGRPDRLVAGAQTPGMSQRHHRPSGQQPGEHHGGRARGVHRLAGGAGQVHTTMAGMPILHRGVEGTGDGRRRAQRPVQAIVVGGRGHRADQGRTQRQRDPPHPGSSPRRARRGHPARPALWTTPPLGEAWQKHPPNRCKLLVAARPRADFARPRRVSGSTRRTQSHAGRSRPGFPAGSGIAAGARARLHPMPGDNRHT